MTSSDDLLALKTLSINGKISAYCPKHDRFLEDWQMHCPSCTHSDIGAVMYRGLYGVHQAEKPNEQR